MIVELTHDERHFINAYVTTAEFVDPMDAQFYVLPDKVVLCPVWEREMVIDCLAFLSKFGCYVTSNEMLEHMAHDFYLSRNGHGTGFWDDGAENYPTWLAEKMQRFSEAMGEHQIMYEEEE